MNDPLEPAVTGQPGAYLPASIQPEEIEDNHNASPALEYTSPPIDRLPSPLAGYVAACAEAIGCDPCLVAMPALAACAAAIGDARLIQVKIGWNEFPILWTVGIAPSGALKTPALKAAMLGLEEAQRKIYDEYRLAEGQHTEAVAKWKSEGMKTAEPMPPKAVSYYVGDATIQAVCKLLGGKPRPGCQPRPPPDRSPDASLDLSSDRFFNNSCQLGGQAVTRR